MKPRTILALVVLALLIVTAAWAASQGVNVFTPGPQSQGQQSPAQPDGTNTPAPTRPAPRPTPQQGDPDADGTGGIPNGAFQATVTYVHDGDTLYLDDEKVRLIGIDTPEVGEYAECYGDEARELLRDLLPEGERVWALEDRDPADHYDRWLLYVFTSDGIFVNLEMVDLGAADAIRVGDNDAYWPQLRDAERAARNADLGMWGACSY